MLSCSAQATRPTAVVSGKPVRYPEPQHLLHRRLQSAEIGDLRLRTSPVRLETLLAPEGFGPGPALPPLPLVPAVVPRPAHVLAENVPRPASHHPLSTATGLVSPLPLLRPVPQLESLSLPLPLDGFLRLSTHLRRARLVQDVSLLPRSASHLLPRPTLLVDALSHPYRRETPVPAALTGGRRRPDPAR